MPRAAQAVFLLLAASIVSSAGAQSGGGQPDHLVKTFVSGGQAFLRLSAGGYRIEGTSDEQIRIRWRTRDPEDMRGVRVSADVSGRTATVRTDGPGHNFQVSIGLPSRTDLTVRLSAGELDIRDIEGSMDIDAWAGEINVRIGEADRYRHVDTSVTFGEIDALPFRVNKGGIFRAFKADGKGPYDLRVKLFAGEVNLLR